MKPSETARADQVRAALRHALAAPCSCDDCPTDEDLQAALALDDAALLALIGAE